MFRALALFLALTLVFPWPALADNVVNDVTVQVTITSGNSAVVNYWLVATNNDGRTGCNATSFQPVTVTINKPSQVSASAGSLSFTSCGTGSAQAVTFSSSTPGSYTITASASGGAGGSFNTSPATFTLTVSPPSDTTAPVITANVSGTLGNNGWYKSDVTVTWTVTDPESAISSSSGCGATTINSDTAGTTLTCTATSAGGTSSASVTIKRDATNPGISGSRTPAANAAGWNNGDVTVSFSCSDNLSGVASCPAPVTVSSEGANQSASGTATDVAGNSASASFGPINIDKTAPSIAVSSPGSVYLLNQAVPAIYACTDLLSGVANCSGTVANGTNIDTSSVGVKTFSVTARDAAGNTASYSANYTVTYGVRALYDQGKAAKSGSTVPVKLQLVDAGGNNVSSGSVTVTAVGVSLKTSSASGAVEDSGNANPDNNFRYDSSLGGYIFNLSTRGLGTGTYVLRFVAANDPVTHTVEFQVK